MIKQQYKLVIIGAGPAGLSLAAAAFDCELKDILLLERNDEPGGILNQCIHHGFGGQVFHTELTGPAYAERLLHDVKQRGIPMLLRTMALSIDDDRHVTFISPEHGVCTIAADAIALANGCRERTREAITVPGARCAGIYPAGTAQYLINVEGAIPGRRVVILGSGDIGLIMARRLVLEGSDVVAVLEKNPYPGGLQRNIQQCLRDYDIPLHLSTTVTRIIGHGRVEAIETAQLDASGSILDDSKKIVPCDTLLLSVGLIPEADILHTSPTDSCKETGGPVVDDSFQTNVPGIFACGNVAYVHNLVDTVTLEARRMAAAITAFVRGGSLPRADTVVVRGDGVAMAVPQRLVANRDDCTIILRASTPLANATITATDQNGLCLASAKRVRIWPSDAEELTIPRLAADITSVTVAIKGDML